MRSDSRGLFWEDIPVERTSGSRAPISRTPPPIPETGWAPPTSFPRLDAAEAICIDLETYDPELLTHGPGWGRGVGHIVGIAVGLPTGERWYFPMRHEHGGGNLDANQVLRWARHELSRPHQPKVGANLMYDLGWLAQEGVEVKGELIDVLFAEPLLDEHRFSYSLDAVATTHLGENKVGEALYDWCHRAYGGTPGRKQAGNIYRAPVALVGPYAEGDVDLPLRVWQHQKKMLEEQGLMDLFHMECKLIPILVAMRMRGSPVNINKAEQVGDWMDTKATEAAARIKYLVGFDVNPDVKADLVRAFNQLGLSYNKTAKGNPSFTKDFLEHHPHEFAQQIRELRKWQTARGTFIDGYILKHGASGIIHAEFHPLRSEAGGTVVGRFSSSNPNLTNIPARDPEIGPRVRSLFLPHDGDYWDSNDYSQIQFRIMTSYAMGPGSDEARERYRNDPATDYHIMAQDEIRRTTGLELERKPVKNINFGLAFTMGLHKLAAGLGMTPAQVQPLLDAYHDGLPFVRHTSDAIAQRARTRGHIFGVLGRRHRFPFWEPKCWGLRDHVKLSTDKEDVLQQVAALVANPPKGIKGRATGGAARAFVHLGLNRLAQDGEGSHMKMAMVKCHEAGLYDVLGVPLNTVHDEKNMSNPGTPEAEEAAKEMRHIMTTAVEWRVPVLVTREVGPNWGSLKKV